MKDYNGNGREDREDYIIFEDLNKAQEELYKDRKSYSAWEYIGAFIIIALILKLLHVI